MDSEKFINLSSKNLENLERLIIDDDGDLKTFRIITTKKRKKTEDLLMEILIVGRINLYQKVNIINPTYSADGFFANTGSYSEKFYFLKKYTDTIAYFCVSTRTSQNKFIDVMSEYFENCHSINIEEFNTSSLENLVRSYNLNCK